MTDGEQQRGSTLGLAITNYFKTGLGIVTGPITARALGPAGAGVVAGVAVYDTLTTVLFSFGLPSAASYFAMKRTYARDALMGLVFRASLMGLPIVAVVAYLIVEGPLLHFGTSVRAAAIALVFLSPVSAVGLTGRGFLIADGDLATIRNDELIPFVVNAAVVIPLGLVGALTVFEAVFAIVIGNFLAVAYTFVKAGVMPKGAAPAAPLLSYAGRNLFASLATFGNRIFDQALVGPVLGVRQLGYYAVAVSVSGAPIGLAQAIGIRAYGRVGSDDNFAVGRAEEAVRVTILSTGVLVAGFAVLAPVAIPIAYGATFHPAVAPTLLLLPGTIGFALSLTANQCAAAMGVPEYATAGSVVGLVITLGGLPFALSLWGITGAAAVSSIAYAAMGAVPVVLLRRSGVRRVVPGVADITAAISQLRRRLTRRRSA